ncbi:MAG: peptidylprolyl isomerase [Aggregatilineales bacterium]
MSKRGQTSGMPKRSSTTPTVKTEGVPAHRRQQPRLMREYRTKSEREAAIQRLVLLVVFGALGFGLLIVAIAFVIDRVIVPQQPVAQIYDTTITVAEFQERVRLERALRNDELNSAIAEFQTFGFTSDQIIQILSTQPPYANWLNELQVSDQLGNRVLNQMVDEELLRRRAAELGITITDEDVQAEINVFFGYDPLLAMEPTATPEPSPTRTPFVSPTPTLTPTPSPTPEQTPTPSLTPVPSPTPMPTPDATQRAEAFVSIRDDFFSALQRDAGVSDDVIRSYFETRALIAAMRDFVTDEAEISPLTQFANVRHIVVAVEERAFDLLSALRAGESFSELAEAASIDPSSAQGGNLGWRSINSLENDYGLAFAEVVRAIEIGQLSEPIQTGSGYHILQIRGREEREMSEVEYENERDAAFAQFQRDLRAAAADAIEIFDIWIDNVPQEPRFFARGL